eukprot:scaffold173893_cov24-Tisochrysis_lutea.AAC.4
MGAVCTLAYACILTRLSKRPPHTKLGKGNIGSLRDRAEAPSGTLQDWKGCACMGAWLIVHKK